MRAKRVRQEIQAILETRTRDEWEAVFASCDACVEPVLSADELERHPQHAAREMFFSLGNLKQIRTPFGSASGHRAPPGLGEHTDAILGEAGFSDGEIAALRTAAAVK